MPAPNRMREIRRLTTEISTLNSRIREHVYRRAWDREVLQGLSAQLETKKRRLEELRLLSIRQYPRGSMIGPPNRTDEEPLTFNDTTLIAKALHAQRPHIYEPDGWPAFRRACAALSDHFARELGEGGRFDPLEFLVQCGLPLTDAERIVRQPEDFIRRSEDTLNGEQARG